MNSEDRHGYALIVGISNYQDTRIPKLNCTVPDAQAVFDLLTNPNVAGFETENVKILLDEEGTLNKIKDAISNWLFKNADEDSIVIIFFAGHGGVEEDRFGIEPDHLSKYLLPYDTLFDNFSASALSNSDFNKFLGSIKSKRMVVFMDSCYSGGVTKKARDVKIIGDPYEKMAEGEGRLVIAASQPDQRSFEDKDLGHGVFTHHLIEALSGAADSDNDGYVSAMEVYQYLSDKVPETAIRLAGGIQEPILRGDLKTDFVLTADRKKVEEIEKEKIREKKIKKLSEWYHDEEIGPSNYELACKLIKTDYEELGEEDKKVFRSLDDLLSDRISVSTFLHDFEIIKGVKGLHIPKFEEARVKADENKKRITELTSEAQRPFEAEKYEEAIPQWQAVLKLQNIGEQFQTIDKWKWGSMFASLLFVLFSWYVCFVTYPEDIIIYLLIFGFPVTTYLLYKERSERIRYGTLWILFPILTFFVCNNYSVDHILSFGFFFILAYIIDLIYIIQRNKEE